MAKKTKVNLRIDTFESNDLWEWVQVVHQLDENNQPMWSEDHNDMKAYMIGIGWDHTYLTGSTRTEYSTFVDRLHQFRNDLHQAAALKDDAIIAFSLVYAHEIYHVRKCYPDCIIGY